MHNVKIHVANLPFETTEDELRTLFSQHGEVLTLRLVRNREGESRGFAFVGMRQEEAVEAIGSLDGVTLGDRRLRVSPAQPPQERFGAHTGGRR